MKTISILGCGWLGFPLAKSLLAKGFTVKGSTTTEAKLAVLEKADIRAFLISLSAEGVTGAIKSLLDQAEVLVIDIPPGSKKGPVDFALKIEKLLPFIAESNVKQVVFVSSTSVYGRNEGLVTEAITPLPETENARQLLEAETLLREQTGFETTVVRFGGLIGPGRHPVVHLAGRENVAHPQAAINLIDQADCIGIIEKIIEQHIGTEVFNAVTPYHPTREIYYTKKAIALGLPVPLFSKQQDTSGKIVDSSKLQQRLPYTFKNTAL